MRLCAVFAELLSASFFRLSSMLPAYVASWISPQPSPGKPSQRRVSASYCCVLLGYSYIHAEAR